jgi:hypothetical protein
MDILMLILTCSLIQDDVLVRSIIWVQSDNHAYYVGDQNGGLPPQYSETFSDAERVLANIHRRGGKALIGLMGIPENIAAGYDLKPEDLFDPCTNIKIGTSILSSISAASGNVKGIRKNILIQYSEMLGLKDNLLVDLVLNVASSFDKSSDDSDDTLMQSGIDSQGINLLENDNIFLKGNDVSKQSLSEGQRQK